MAEGREGLGDVKGGSVVGFGRQVEMKRGGEIERRGDEEGESLGEGGEDSGSLEDGRREEGVPIWENEVEGGRRGRSEGR